MKKRPLSLVLLFGICLASFAQKSNKTSTSKPKLVVGIVVDQMRYDYLYRYATKMGAGGFKRLMNEGFNCTNNHYNYAATYTGPGHAHIFNGSVPAISGVVANEWHDKYQSREVYVAEDTTVHVVGPGDPAAGKMSPQNMKVTSICDQQRIASNFQSRTYGVAIKDRGSIMPAGHTANGAFWFDAKTGTWITSSFYMDVLPEWVNQYNQEKYAGSFVGKTWNTLLPINAYTESEADDQKYENVILGETKATFPHEIKSLGALALSPFGNTLTNDFAQKLITAEKLGQRGFTDFLTLSFSTPDYVGHAFGTASVEIEDIYLRLDKEIEQLLGFLDKTQGEGNYTIFLSADHGVADIPAFSKKHKIPAGLYVGLELKTEIEKAFKVALGEGKWINNVSNYQIYLNHQLLEERKLSVKDILAKTKPEMFKIEGAFQYLALADLTSSVLPADLKEKITNVYHAKLSGDFMFLLEPAWFSGYPKGTTHGTVWAYDTHVPLLFYGWGVNKGQTSRKTVISDIAPTMAQILNILEPNGSIGQPINEVIKR